VTLVTALEELVTEVSAGPATPPTPVETVTVGEEAV